MEPERIQHLQMVGGVIQRMAQNSFALKGWCITLIAAILALGAKDADPRVIAVALLPALVFWLLDGYYLWQERRFRELYNRVRKSDRTIELFSMDTSGEKHVRYWRSVFAHVNWPYYGVMIVISAGVFLVLTYFPMASKIATGTHG